MNSRIFKITPVAKPRMTRRDKWEQRKCVVQYRAFKDAVRRKNLCISDVVRVVFRVPMPASWSEKKKLEMDGQPHQSRPDLDNFLKALLDAVFKEDSHIWKATAEKRWARSGAIEIYENEESSNA